MTSECYVDKDFYRNWNKNCDESLKFGWPEYKKRYIFHMEKSSKIIEMCILENERFILWNEILRGKIVEWKKKTAKFLNPSEWWRGL